VFVAYGVAQALYFIITQIGSRIQSAPGIHNNSIQLENESSICADDAVIFVTGVHNQNKSNLNSVPDFSTRAYVQNSKFVDSLLLLIARGFIVRSLLQASAVTSPVKADLLISLPLNSIPPVTHTD